MMFSDGTSILLFIDIVSKMILLHLNSINENNEIFHDNFKILMFVGFQRRKEAIEIPFLEGL
jgi:hypothetical protein